MLKELDRTTQSGFSKLTKLSNFSKLSKAPKKLLPLVTALVASGVLSYSALAMPDQLRNLIEQLPESQMQKEDEAKAQALANAQEKKNESLDKAIDKNETLQSDEQEQRIVAPVLSVMESIQNSAYLTSKGDEAKSNKSEHSDIDEFKAHIDAQTSKQSQDADKDKAPKSVETVASAQGIQAKTATEQHTAGKTLPANYTAMTINTGDLKSSVPPKKVTFTTSAGKEAVNKKTLEALVRPDFVQAVNVKHDEAQSKRFAVMDTEKAAKEFAIGYDETLIAIPNDPICNVIYNSHLLEVLQSPSSPGVMFVKPRLAGTSMLYAQTLSGAYLVLKLRPTKDMESEPIILNSQTDDVIDEEPEAKAVDHTYLPEFDSTDYSHQLQMLVRMILNNAEHPADEQGLLRTDDLKDKEQLALLADVTQHLRLLHVSFMYRWDSKRYTALHVQIKNGSIKPLAMHADALGLPDVLAVAVTKTVLQPGEKCDMVIVEAAHE